jgi:hypothetical protein
MRIVLTTGILAVEYAHGWREHVPHIQVKGNVHAKHSRDSPTRLAADAATAQTADQNDAPTKHAGVYDHMLTRRAKGRSRSAAQTDGCRPTPGNKKSEALNLRKPS